MARDNAYGRCSGFRALFTADGPPSAFSNATAVPLPSSRLPKY